ncbi:hypothetical protein K0T92_15320 [Paenibacillus oenotherae]|uniref:DUF5050 domain-containing protein n=1 Tax=Paenibacillus oenotherae TaxID=1435645 RepID=A0ABS7D8B5_9BACL|nr:hypothetical protein [Paenibacillus oenotherae]MBW7476115.1 hypothetical protein [Paenibacillus oenotherae]
MRKFFNSKSKLISAFAIVLVLFLIFLSMNQTTAAEYSSRLYTPTYTAKIGDHYFIVDCWNHRIIYNDDIDTDIKNWSTLDNDIAGPHSIASDSELYVAEDTGRNKLFVYTLTADGFKKTQIIDDIAGRPHRTIYDPSTEKFYVLTSTSQNMYVLSNQNGKLVIDKQVHLAFLEQTYTRSFSIIDDKMYFVSGPNKITIVDYINKDFEVAMQYDVPQEYSAMNDIFKIDDYYYISSYPEKLIRLKELSRFDSAENIYDELQFKGTPYYFSTFDNKFYVTEIDSHSGIKSFTIQNGSISDVETINDSGPADDLVLQRKSELPT